MADVKWIKLMTNIWDNRKIKQIKKMPDGKSTIIIWFQILCLAGEINDNGLIYLSKDIPYTDEMLATEFGEELATIRLSLQVLEHFKMIKVVDNVLLVSNWEKYQNVGGLEKIREQNRARQIRYKEKQKLLINNVTDNVTDNVGVTHGNAIDIDIDKDKDKDKDKEEDKDKDKEVFKRDKLDKLDKTTLTSCVYNSLTNELIRRKFISEADLDIYRYDELLSELMQNYEYQDLLQVISYVIKNMKNKEIEDKFNYFNTSMLANLSMLNTRKKLKYTIDRETT